MTFLYGQTTMANLGAKLMDLFSGASADDHGNTVEPASRWRTRLTGVAGDLSFAPPAAQDDTLTQEHRIGYFTRYDDSLLYHDKTAAGKCFIRQATIWGNWNAATMGDVLFVSMQITTANTAANDYSTARVTVRAIGLSAAGAATGVLGATVLTPTVDGTITITFAAGYVMTAKIGDAATGIVTVGTFFYRVYTSDCRGGYDYWRRAGRNIDGLATFTTAPPGVQGTDWVLNLGPTSRGTFGPNSALYGTSSWYSYVSAVTQGSNGVPSHMGMHGLGVKTNAALTGDRYVATFTKQEGAFSFAYNSTILVLKSGGMALGGDGSALNGQDGHYWQQVTFLSFAAVNVTTATVQYWISVTATHISIVINVEGASVWTLSGNLIAKVNQDQPEYGTCWMAGVPGAPDKWYRFGLLGMVEYALARGAGVTDNGRDWQTGQGRSDLVVLDTTYASWRAGEAFPSWYQAPQPVNPVQSVGNQGSGVQYPPVPYTRDRSTFPSLADPRWQMAGMGLYDGPVDSTDTTQNLVGVYRSRGYVNEGMLLVARSGFASGDELTDLATGKKYMLWLPTATFGLGYTSATFTWGLAQEEV